MRRIIVSAWVMLILNAAFGTGVAMAQYGGGGRPGGGMPGGGMSGAPPSGGQMSSSPSADKPEVAAKKWFSAGVKSLNKAMELDAAAAKATDPDKKSTALAKAGDNYNRALDLFTESLSNKGDSVEAWDHVGYVHLRLGAYAEAVDDYNHVLALKPDLLEATERRGEAYLRIDRLDEAKGAYMDLFNHERGLADQLMTSMQQWMTDHRANPNGMRASDVEAFEKWLQERDGIAKQTASLPH